MKVLFVCLGNICRSPTAEAVLRALSEKAVTNVEVDSAGTAAFHIGCAPDVRTQKAASLRGMDMSPLTARQVCIEDFQRFDYIFAMDKQNLNDLNDLRPDSSHAELALFLEVYGTTGCDEVPDPYYGQEDGFERVLDLLTGACEVFLEDKVKAK